VSERRHFLKEKKNVFTGAGPEQEPGAANTPDEPDHGGVRKRENRNQQQFVAIRQIPRAEHDQKWTAYWGQSVGLLTGTVQGHSASEVSVRWRCETKSNCGWEEMK